MVSVHKMTFTHLFMAFVGAVLLVTAYMLYPADASFTANEYIYSTGGVHINNDHYWQDGSRITQVWPATQYHEGAAGAQYVTGPGQSESDISTSLGGEFRQSSGIRYTGGGVTWDTLYSGSIIPNESPLTCTAGDLSIIEGTDPGTTPLDQSIVGMTGAQGPSGYYTSDKFNSEEDYALSSRFEGRGMFHGDLFADTISGTDANTSTANYAADIKRHVFASSNLTGGIIGSIDWTMTDFSDPFNSTNQTNVTPADEVINITEEA